MGLWHGVEYYEKEKIVGDEYYQQWSNVSTPINSPLPVPHNLAIAMKVSEKMVEPKEKVH